MLDAFFHSCLVINVPKIFKNVLNFILVVNFEVFSKREANFFKTLRKLCILEEILKVFSIHGFKFSKFDKPRVFLTGKLLLVKSLGFSDNVFDHFFLCFIEGDDFGIELFV